MTRTFTSLFLALPIAGFAAWRLGGFAEAPSAEGVGVMVGFLVGFAVSVWGIYFQRHTLMHRPEKAGNAVVIDFGVKLVVVLASAMVLTSMPEVAARCDMRTFLLTFASISLVVLTFGTKDAVSALSNQAPAHKPAQ